jgi:hypothetical protein
MAGTPILPAVVAIELLIEAASLVDRRRVVGLSNVAIHSPLSFNSREPRVALVDVVVEDGRTQCHMTCDQFDRQSRLVEAGRLMVSAEADCSNAQAELAQAHCGEPPLGWFPMQYPDTFAVQHGPKMQSLKNLFCQHDGGYGRIVAPAIAELAAQRGGEGWSLSPAVLDACLVACSTYSFVMCSQRVEIPKRFERLRFACLPREGEECIVRFYYRGNDAKASRYDFVLFGEDERVILRADGYESALVTGGEKP